MTSLYLWLCALLGIVACSEGIVVELTPDTLENIFDNSDDWLIMFYAPWCHHCKDFMPVYDDFASRAATVNPKLTVAKLDSTLDKAIGFKFNVQGYPTLIFVHGNQYFKYKGKREINPLMEYTLTTNSDTKGGKTLPKFKVGFFKSLNRSNTKVALLAFSFGGAIALGLLLLLVCCGDGNSTEQLEERIDWLMKNKDKELPKGDTDGRTKEDDSAPQEEELASADTDEKDKKVSRRKNKAAKKGEEVVESKPDETKKDK